MKTAKDIRNENFSCYTANRYYHSYLCDAGLPITKRLFHRARIGDFLKVYPAYFVRRNLSYSESDKGRRYFIELADGVQYDVFVTPDFAYSSEANAQIGLSFRRDEKIVILKNWKDAK